MKHTAYGYTHHDPAVAPDPVTIVPVDSERDYDTLMEARRDLWWRLESTPEWWETPTPTSRMVGALLAVTALIAVLGLVGWIEGL